MSKIVGILNVTPDSFFDGGKYNSTDQAIKQLESLIASGALVIDIGAESTRPNATPITSNEEQMRLKNILPEIVRYVFNYNKENQHNIKISLDSRHHQTVFWALNLGDGLSIDIINDVSGFENSAMIDLAAQSGKKIVVMHNLGVPAMANKIIDESLDAVQVVCDWMKNKMEYLQKNGVKKAQIIFDIGIGFGKNALQSIRLLQEIDRFRSLDIPLYVGHSNKSFLDFLEIKNGNLFFLPKAEINLKREEKTFAVSAYLAKKNIEYLRVHNVAQNIF